MKELWADYEKPWRVGAAPDAAERPTDEQLSGHVFLSGKFFLRLGEFGGIHPGESPRDRAFEDGMGWGLVSGGSGRVGPGLASEGLRCPRGQSTDHNILLKEL